MEILDIFGHGICHMEPARSLEGAWLCSRCTGLFGGGLLGVVHSTWFSRRLPMHWQIGIVVLLIVPMGIDTIVLGRGSAVDVNTVRGITGLLAGVGSGLLYGARGLPRVRLESGGVVLRWAPYLAWGTVVLGVLLWVVADVVVVFDLVVLVGLACLCATATAWGLDVACWLWARYHHRPFERAWRIHGVLLAGLVAGEFLFVTLLPNSLKPGLHWVRWIWELI